MQSLSHGVLVLEPVAALLALYEILGSDLSRQLPKGVLQDGGGDVGVAQPAEAVSLPGAQHKHWSDARGTLNLQRTCSSS